MKLEGRVSAVYATHEAYVKRARDNILASKEILDNLEELMVASADFQCFLNKLMPFNIQYELEGEVFNSSVADYKFTVKEDKSRNIECGLVNLQQNTLHHHMSVKFMTDMNKAVKDPAVAAAMITLSNKDFYKRYKKTPYSDGEELYAVFKYVLTKILTT
jgi:hypothetical protein